MEKVYSYGLIFLYTRANGRMDKLMEREDLYIPKEMCMKVNGKMIRLMAMVHIITQMVLHTLENGKMIYSMGME